MTVTNGMTQHSAVVTLPSDTTILIVREFAAPRPLVWRAWTEPELIKRWWSGQRGETTLVESDFRVGGRWRQVMVAHGGFEVAFHGEFREIVEPEKIVQTETYEAFPDAYAVNTVTFTELDGGDRTRVELLVEHTEQAHRDMHVRSGMEGGVQEGLDLLEEIAVSLA